jgi:hypothetical protein
LTTKPVVHAKGGGKSNAKGKKANKGNGVNDENTFETEKKGKGRGKYKKSTGESAASDAGMVPGTSDEATPDTSIAEPPAKKTKMSGSAEANIRSEEATRLAGMAFEHCEVMAFWFRGHAALKKQEGWCEKGRKKYKQAGCEKC